MLAARRLAGVAAGSAALGAAWLCQPASQDRLSPGQPIACAVQSRRWVSEDSLVLRFQLPSPSFALGLPVPGHVMVVDAANNYRPYSPITIDSVGFFELLVRKYPRGEFSSQLAALQPGDQATIVGPVESRYTYHRGATPALGLIAAGTGITPMWQIIQRVLSDPHDTTTVSLVYASRSSDSILLKEELDRAQAAHPDRLTVCHVISQPGCATLPPGMRRGRIDESLLQDVLPPPADGSEKSPQRPSGRGNETCQLLVSGPEAMLVELCGRRARDGGTYFAPGEEGVAQARHPALGGTLRRLGYRADQVKWL